MPFVLELTASTYADLKQQVLDLAAGFTSTSAAAVTPSESASDATVAAKPAAKPAAKAKTETKPKVEPEVEKAKEEKTKPVAEEPEQDFTSIVRDVVLAVVEKCGRERMESILEGYGIARASQVAVDRRDELLAELREALAA